MEPRKNEGPRDWQNLFAIPRFRYIEVLFHIFYYYWSEDTLGARDFSCAVSSFCLMVTLACVASVSSRVRRESWDESKKKDFRAVTRLETLATQARMRWSFSTLRCRTSTTPRSMMKIYLISFCNVYNYL